jgi:hypothetical protein
MEWNNGTTRIRNHAIRHEIFNLEAYRMLNSAENAEVTIEYLVDYTPEPPPEPQEQEPVATPIQNLVGALRLAQTESAPSLARTIKIHLQDAMLYEERFENSPNVGMEMSAILLCTVTEVREMIPHERLAQFVDAVGLARAAINAKLTGETPARKLAKSLLRHGGIGDF